MAGAAHGGAAAGAGARRPLTAPCTGDAQAGHRSCRTAGRRDRRQRSTDAPCFRQGRPPRSSTGSRAPGRARPPGPVRPCSPCSLATAVLYLWGLRRSGWANAFYSAAAQAGSESWKAFFFGSSDAANSITVDKTPASLWVMALSVRIFGLSSLEHPRARRR